MSLPFQIDGATTVIPGVYDTFRVQNSIPAPVPAGRSILVIGEAEEGIPGAELDLRLNFYTGLDEVRDFYKSGPIVDAARQIFTNQPSPVFAGNVQRLYVYKTNNSTRASKAIASPTGFGDLLAARYGEAGNLIKSQIKSAQAESKPTKTFYWLPSPVAKDLKVAINGVVLDVALGVGALGHTVRAALHGLTGLAATGGIDRVVNGASITVDVTAAGDLLTITKTAGAGDFGTASQVGDIAYVDVGLGISGALDENAGVYSVVSWSSTVVVLRQLRHFTTAEGNADTFDALVGATLAVGDLKVNGPITVTVDAATATGAGATLELLEDAADKVGAALMFTYSDLSAIISSNTAAIASISATVPSAGKLAVTLSTSSFTRIPQVGDIVAIPRGSLLSGATALNVGMMIVESASAKTITMSHLFAGMTTEAITSVALNGATTPLTLATGFVSTSFAAKRIDSVAEAKVKIVATRISDGVTLPETAIGGVSVLEIGYYNAAATACSLSINSQRVLTITPTGTGLTPITVNTRKYRTLGDLADFLSTQGDLSARVPDAKLKSLSTSVLDMVSSVGCLEGQSKAAYVAKIKKDYADWKQFFVDNPSLLSFREGVLVLKAGLPGVETDAEFLSGAAVGHTTNAAVQAGLDAGLKVDVRHVIPLFSRDARYDVEDAMTDASSTYEIDSINAAVKAHISTASSTLFKRKRFGMISWDGDFADTLVAIGEISFERCQMCFERHSALDAEGNLKKFLPWMAAVCIATGRSQAILGTSMLRKPFLLASAEHVGQVSLFSDTLVQDFDPEDRGQLEQAINAGLVVLRAVSGFGVRMESPDLSTRSRVNDPQGWVWERVNVLFVCDEVVDTVRSIMENYIGERQTDTPLAVVQTSINDSMDVFRPGSGNGAIEFGRVLKVEKIGTGYKAKIQIKPVEAIEAMILDVEAVRE